MSCVQDCFSFLRGAEEADNVREELLGFLDGYDWQEFLESVSNEGGVGKGSVISNLVRKIRTGVLSSEALKDYDPRVLVDSMNGTLDNNFVEVLLDFIDKGCHSVAPFFSVLAQSFPSGVIDKLKQANMHDKGLIDVTVIVLEVYFRTQARPLQEYLLGLPLNIVIPGMYQYIIATSRHETRHYVQLLLNMTKRRGFFERLCEMRSDAIRDQCEFVIDMILDFIEKGHNANLFAYSEVFSKVFDHCSCPFLQKILVRRAGSTNEALVQIQIELLDASSAALLKDILRNKGNPFREDELVKIVEEFHNSKEIPREISRKFMFERKAVTEVLAPALRKLANTNAMADELVLALEKKGMIPKCQVVVNWEQTINQLKANDAAMANIADVLEQSKVDCGSYAPVLFNSFHRALYSRHSDDIVAFVDAFEMKVLKRLSFASQDKLAETVALFLCSNLADQHRWSLSIFALRCNMSKFVHQFFDCASDREVKILAYLHKAAIVSASKIKLDETRTTAPNAVDLNESIMCGLARLPHLVIQRLRWRVLRGDASETICFLPEFLLLSDSDLPLYFKWECTQETNQEILSRLGITTSVALYPKFFFTLLSTECSESVTRTMLPLFSKIDQSQITIPENPNLRVLFQTSILWCPRIMCNPVVISCLRDPTIEISQALLNALPGDSEVEKLFTMFPHGFAAMLYNFKDLYGAKPQCLCNAFQVMEGDLTAYPEAPKFAVIAIVSAYARNHLSLVNLAKRRPDPTWVTYCFVFLICLRQEEDAAELLTMHDFLFRVLRQGVSEERAFFRAGVWTDSVIDFALYCAYNDIAFKNVDEWQQFFKTVRQASWPDRIMFDNENLRVMQKYSTKYCL